MKTAIRKSTARMGFTAVITKIAESTAMKGSNSSRIGLITLGVSFAYFLVRNSFFLLRVWQLKTRLIVLESQTGTSKLGKLLAPNLSPMDLRGPTSPRKAVRY